MANWFKVYETDLDDSKFQLLVDENPTVISVWFWILTECAKFKDGVIDFKFEPRYFRMIGKKINQDSACISDALNALHKDGFIILGENSIELMGWESRQSEFMRKQKGKEIKKVKESLNLSPDKDLIMSEVRPDIVPIRGEEKRREEKEENKKEENILNTVGGKEKTILSSKLDGKINKPISTFSTSKEIQSTSKEIQYLPPKQEKTPYTAEFEEFWAVYNKKEGSKAEAFKKFKQALKEVELPRLIEKVKAYNRSKRVQDGYKCDPVTWLNQRRWESDYTPTTFLNAEELNECWDSLPLERQKNIEAVRWLMS